MEIFFEEALSSHPNKSVITSKVSSILLVYLTRNLVEKNLVQLGILKALGDRQINKALEIIHERFQENITLGIISNEVGLSRTKLSRQFKRLLGVTYYDYLSNHRLAEAKKMLEKNKSVKSTSIDVGFTSTSSFIRKFKKHFDTTPSTWQKRNRQVVS